MEGIVLLLEYAKQVKLAGDDAYSIESIAMRRFDTIELGFP